MGDWRMGGLAALLCGCSFLFEPVGSGADGSDGGDQVARVDAAGPGLDGSFDASSGDASPEDPCALPAASPAAHLRFNEPPLTGYDGNINIVGSPTVTAGGPPCGSSFSFAPGEYVDLDVASGSLDGPLAALSFRAVVQVPGTVSHSYSIVSKDAGGNNAGDLGLYLHDRHNQTGLPLFVFRIQDGITTSPPGTAYHICSGSLPPATYEVRVFAGGGPSATMWYRRWLDSPGLWEPFTQAAQAGSISFFGETQTCGEEPDIDTSKVAPDTDNDIRIGGSNSGTQQDHHFVDKIYDVAIYTVRLSEP